MTPKPTAVYADLKGKAVLVSGGASGIGASIVEAFCLQGANTCFIDIQEEAGQKLVEELQAQTGTRPSFVPCDITNSDNLRAVIDRFAADNDRLDVLVNNAANDERHEFSEVSPEYWDRQVAVNLRHQFFAVQAAFPHMKAAGGSVINFSSIAPVLRPPRLSVYIMCKAAVHGLTRSLAREFGSAGVRVNSLVPGCVLTERQLKLWISPQDEQRIQEQQCLKRRLVGQDIAQMTLFLASDVSSACTSQEFIVDAGII